MRSVTAPARWRVYEWNPAISIVLHFSNIWTFQNRTCCAVLFWAFHSKTNQSCSVHQHVHLKWRVLCKATGERVLCLSLCCSSYSRRYSILLLLPYDTCLTSHDPWIIYNHTTSPDESARSALWVGYSGLRCSGTEDDEEEVYRYHAKACDFWLSVFVFWSNFWLQRRWQHISGKGLRQQPVAPGKK